MNGLNSLTQITDALGVTIKLVNKGVGSLY